MGSWIDSALSVLQRCGATCACSHIRQAARGLRVLMGSWSPYLLCSCGNRLRSAKLSRSDALVKNHHAFVKFKSSSGKDFTLRGRQEPRRPALCPLACCLAPMKTQPAHSTGDTPCNRDEGPGELSYWLTLGWMFPFCCYFICFFTCGWILGTEEHSN